MTKRMKYFLKQHEEVTICPSIFIDKPLVSSVDCKANKDVFSCLIRWLFCVRVYMASLFHSQCLSYISKFNWEISQLFFNLLFIQMMNNVFWISTENEHDNDYHKMRNGCQHQKQDAIHRSPCFFFFFWMMEYEMCCHYELVKFGQTITADVYFQQLDQVSDGITMKINRLGKWCYSSAWESKTKFYKTYHVKSSLGW